MTQETLHSSRSKTCEYLHSLNPKEVRPDYILKTARARDLIANLPSPSNMERNLNLVPNIEVAFMLSTSSQLPEFVTTKVKKSGNKETFKDDSLLGLCTSGRGLPVEIFLHDHFMMASDPSGELLEEVAWHEVVHGIEGIKQSENGTYTRNIPWSYRLQKEMLKIDNKNEHISKLLDDPKTREYTNYLRRGTELQQNVSEIFARVAVLFMYEIKENNTAPESYQDLVSFLFESPDLDAFSRKDSNLFDFQTTLCTFSEEAQILFASESINLINRVANLYGCKPL